MPTMSQSTVSVLPMYSRSTKSLEDIRGDMIASRPDHASLTGGWASIDNTESGLGTVGGVPPVSDPEIVPSDGLIPETLRARFYFWSPPAPGLKDRPGYDAHAVRQLAAIDVFITQDDDSHVGLLFSSRSRQLLQHRGGIVASLQAILQAGDATIKIDRGASALELQDTDIFLWLTVQRRDRPQIDSDLLLDQVSGITGRDASSRTADLRAGIDFDRPNFLTAVAEADTLGPIAISFVQTVGTERNSYAVKVHIDGGFEIQKNDIHLPHIIDVEEKMLTATLMLAYSLIPRINVLYVADGQNWVSRRYEVIESAMEDLEQRYRNAKAALRERLDSSPARLEPDETDV